MAGTGALDSVKSPRDHYPMRQTTSDPSSRNWFIHRLYLRGEFKECLRMIEDVLKKHQGLSEYPIYVKALILRHSGRIQESLQLLQAATCLNPDNKENLKQVGRSLYLLGKHTSAIEVYEEILSMGKADDWEIFHSIGLCHMYLKDYDRAIECFQQANSINRHDATFLQLGKVHTLREDFKAAISVYLEALEFSPENPELLTTLGLLYLRIGENFRAFDYLGNSLTHDPRNPKTILAAGSIIQDHGDMDVALVKYRVAAVQTPNSAQLWNNIGMCFFGKQRYVASVACLKRALYLDPFEWITSYNLGLVHLNTGQYASAFHYFSSAINLKPDFASSYMYLAITLGRLDDFENACSAFEKAIEMERYDGTIRRRSSGMATFLTWLPFVTTAITCSTSTSLSRCIITMRWSAQRFSSTALKRFSRLLMKKPATPTPKCSNSASRCSTC
jgi:Bardet-Biedl syndrome 4 protein